MVVVLCDSFYTPLAEISIQHAVQLLVTGKAEPIYKDNKFDVATSLGLAPTAIKNWKEKLSTLIEDNCFLVPTVIKLVKQISFRIYNLRPTRNAILRRDKFVCQYCGAKNSLTVDHVIPKSKGGSNTWENLVAACITCNNRKGSKTLEETGLKLKRKPEPWTHVKITSELFMKMIE